MLLPDVGDTVTIRTKHGGTKTGIVRIRCASHVVLNGGGPHGTPLIADDSNIIKIIKNRRERRAAVPPSRELLNAHKPHGRHC